MRKQIDIFHRLAMIDTTEDTARFHHRDQLQHARAVVCNRSRFVGVLADPILCAPDCLLEEVLDQITRHK